MSRQLAARARRWVIKIGSSLITADGQGLDHAAISAWCAQIAQLRKHNVEVVLVSSGAVAEGMVRLRMGQRPEVLHLLQATAAVGQMGLIRAWEHGFCAHDLHAAQVLLTHDDVADRGRYLNARATLKALLKLGVVPVVNENDTVSTDEIRLGDNDSLAALTANLIDADLLVILTDQDGLFDADPRRHPDAKLVAERAVSDPALNAMAGDSKGELGRGGMRTKLSAARIAARSGAATVLANGGTSDVLMRIAKGDAVGTLLLADANPMGARKRWIAGQLQSNGRLHLDAGAARALAGSGKSLLPVGVRAADGEFDRGDLVLCIGPSGEEIARGLCNYGANETRKLLGARRGEILSRLGYPGAEELIHRDNLVLASS
ncbi:MAG: glutamate 5-kinase [Panacagrimonas sp.]